jgi:hypothetical protein
MMSPDHGLIMGLPRDEHHPVVVVIAWDIHRSFNDRGLAFPLGKLNP